MRGPTFACFLLAAALLGVGPAYAQGSAAKARRARPDPTAQVLAEMGLVDNEALQKYVSAVGERVARGAPGFGGRYRFYVIDQWAPNAFALPDGSIFLSRGILALAGSEDELANVLAHEVTHVAQRHAIGRQAVADAANPFFIGFARARYLASFSREQEREADTGGQRLAAAAGYDPAALAVFLRKLEYDERLKLGASRLPNWFDTHPSTAERAGTTYDRSGRIEFTATPGIASDRPDYVSRVDGLTVGEDPSQGIFRGNRFLHPDLGFTISFPDGWNLVNTPQAVGAFSPDRDARLALEMAGDGEDPALVATKYLEERAEETRLEIDEAKATSIFGRKAYEVQASMPTPAGSAKAQLAFIAFGGRVYLISTVARSMSFGGYKGRTAATIRSFRELDAAERDTIKVMRLHTVQARAGETLEQLSRRTGNALDLQWTAVANGIFHGTALQEGQIIKVGREEPYVPRSAPPRATAGVAPGP